MGEHRIHPADHHRLVVTSLEEGLDDVPLPIPFAGEAGLKAGHLVPDVVIGFTADLVTDLRTPDAVTARVHQAGQAFDAEVREVADKVLHGHSLQIERERKRLTSPAAKADLRAAVARARANREARAALLRRLPDRIGRTAAAPLQEAPAVWATVRGAEVPEDSLLGTRARLEALDTEYRTLVAEHPALGALNLAEISPEIGDAELQVKLHAGFDAMQEAIGRSRAAIEAGEIPLGALGPIVQDVLTRRGLTPEAAVAGNQEAKDVLHYLRKENDAQETVRIAWSGLSMTLGLASLLVAGPLATAALSMAGVGVGLGQAHAEFVEAGAIRDVAHAGLGGASGVADADAADEAYAWAGVGLGLAVVDGALLAKSARPAAKQLRSALRPTTGPDAFVTGARPRPPRPAPAPAKTTPGRRRGFYDEVEVRRRVVHEETVRERPVGRSEADRATAVLDRRAPDRAVTEPNPVHDASTVETPAPPVTSESPTIETPALPAARRRALARAPTDVNPAPEPPGFVLHIARIQRTLRRTWDETLKVFERPQAIIIDERPPRTPNAGAPETVDVGPPAPAPSARPAASATPPARPAKPVRRRAEPEPAPAPPSSTAPEATEASPLSDARGGANPYRKLLVEEELRVLDEYWRDATPYEPRPPRAVRGAQVVDPAPRGKRVARPRLSEPVDTVEVCEENKFDAVMKWL